MNRTDIACHSAAQKAARNLLFGCAGLKEGSAILIVREAGNLGYYDPALADCVATAAREIGFVVSQAEVAFDPDASDLPPDLVERMKDVALTVFLARRGDQLRFHAFPPGTRSVVSYALDVDAFSSPFGRAPHTAFVAIKEAVDRALFGAKNVTIRCASGTSVTGHAIGDWETATDVEILRFPMLVPTPVPAQHFSGRVALCGFLVGTGSRYYEPIAVGFDGPVFAEFADGRLTGFAGSPADVATADHHYSFVAERFGIDRDAVHSWHAGLHPACAFKGSAAQNYQRWSGSAFGNPRLLHFHTCGGYAPGEICWNVVDPTVFADDMPVWKEGRLQVDNLAGGADILRRYPEVAAIYANPVRDIGL